MFPTMLHRTRAVAIVCAAAGILAFAPRYAAAQAYPAKPVRVVVPSAPGGSVDTITRLLARKMSEDLGQSVVVENRAGSGGVVGSEYVARATPDGYTLLGAYASHVINPTLYRKLPFDTVRDFAPITQVAEQPLQVVVHPSLPVKNIRDLIALAKKRPGDLLYASAGSGSGGHLANEIFNSMAGGLKMTHVPYKGSSPAITDVVAGHTQLMFITLITSMPHVTSGRLRALAVTSAERTPAAPDTPTVAESGLPGYEAVVHYFLLAPAGTPAAVIDRLNASAVAGLKSKDVIDRLSTSGTRPVPRTPQETARYIESEIRKWGEAVKASGARVG